jgi:predicted metal-dependent hydrolase
VKRLKQIGRQLTDAALQLTLPLFDASPRTNIARSGARLVRLDGRFVEYQLRRSRRRTIGFTIDARGLAVTAPNWVAQSQIETALADRGDWILRKLDEWRDHAARRERLSIRWEDGAAIPYLGQPLTLRVDPAHDGPVHIDGCVLVVAGTRERIQDDVQAWLQKRARTHFGERLDVFARQHGVAPRRWALSSARTRWGSCAADGSIRLNWRLMHFPADIVDYVIAHELAHLREMNHSARFWLHLETLFPDYRRAREWLRTYPDDTMIS